MHDVGPWVAADHQRSPQAPLYHHGYLGTLLLVAVGLAPLVSLGWTYWFAEAPLSLAHGMALVMALAAVGSAWHRRWVRSALLAMLAVANGVVVISHIGWPTPASASLSCDQPLRMVSVNVLYDNRTPLILEDYLRTNRLDVVFLQEVSQQRRWKPVLDTLAGSYPHQVHRGDVAILSKHPLQPDDPAAPLSKILDNWFLKRSVVSAVTQFGDQTVVLLSAHVSSPQTQGLYLERNRQLALMTDALRQEKRPVVVGADLNGVPWNPNIASFRQGAGLRYLPYEGWPIATRPNWLRYGGLQIDYILPSAFAFRGVQAVGSDVGSDHLPLEARLCLKDVGGVR